MTGKKKKTRSPRRRKPAGRIFGAFKWFVRSAFFLVVLAVLGGVAFGGWQILHLDTPERRIALQETVSAALGGEFRFEGGIVPTFNGIYPAIRVHHATLTLADGQQNLQAAHVVAGIPLASLIRQDFDEFHIRLAGLEWRSIRLGQADFSLYLEGARTVVRGFRGRIADGEATGYYELDHSVSPGPVHRLDWSHRNFDYGQFKEGISGRMDLVANLSATGLTLEEVLRNLNGTLRIVGGAGKLEGVNVDFWGADLVPTLLSGGGKDTEMNCIAAGFSITGGLATIERFLFDTPRVTVAGKGAFSIPDRIVNVTLKPKPKNPSLVNLATPVVVKGPIENPEIKPESKEVAKKIGGLLLGAVNPLAIVVPMLSGGTGDMNPCQEYLEGASVEPVP